VLLVENLKPNLLGVSQTCDQGHIPIFDSQKCEIRKEYSGKLMVVAPRTPSNVYILNIEEEKMLHEPNRQKLAMAQKNGTYRF
jgi:hypothetical protein